MCVLFLILYFHFPNHQYTVTADSKQPDFFRIKNFHVRILYIKRAIIGGWDLASDTPILLLNFSQANCVWACEICKTRFLSIFFNLAILCEMKFLQSLFDQQYINVGQIYHIQPQGLVETLMILMFLSLCVYLVSWYQGRLTGTKVCPEWQVKNISFPPSSGTVIFSCTHTIKCPSPKKNCTST